MTEIKDGGPAYPNLKAHDSGPRDARNGGMSLRDWFAGQALVGILSGPMNLTRTNKERVIADTFLIADAMLAAREAKP